MNTQELTTWQRLLALDFDTSDSALPFSKRLARENGWSAAFADGAIAEYRKFCFLAVHAGHPVTPSEEVDQVWHLHMLYSRHYWDTLCRDTLGIELHHGPTQGGAAEGRKFHAWYEHTLAAYRRYFGEPPQDFWPASRARFDARNDFLRVNRRDVVILDRAKLRRTVGAAVTGAAMLGMAQVFAQAHPRAPQSGAVVVLLVFAVSVLVIAVAGLAARAGRAAPRRRGRGDAASAAVFGTAGGAGTNCPPGTTADSGGHCADGGGAAGCGAAGCGGGGGGCGGGGCGGGGS